MKYLLDTNIISELRKKKPDQKLIEWYQTIDTDSIFISCITIGEINHGIHKIRKTDKELSIKLNLWLEEIKTTHSDRIISVDIDIAMIWGELLSFNSTNSTDALIAAQGIKHKMTIVTRNTSHFKDFKVKIINPFEG
jgi:predicted nucleic acid-binding protein